MCDTTKSAKPDDDSMCAICHADLAKVDVETYCFCVICDRQFCLKCFQGVIVKDGIESHICLMCFAPVFDKDTDTSLGYWHTMEKFYAKMKGQENLSDFDLECILMGEGVCPTKKNACGDTPLDRIHEYRNVVRAREAEDTPAMKKQKS